MSEPVESPWVGTVPFLGPATPPQPVPLGQVWFAEKTLPQQLPYSAVAHRPTKAPLMGLLTGAGLAMAAS